jgi:hypothetical protein
MVSSRDLTPREPERVAVATVSPQVSPATIQETVQSIKLLQGMVKEILVRGVDYGRIPGTPQDSLWDPGASLIISSFNCYSGQRRILRLEDNEEKIVAVVEVPIMSRHTGQEVGTGIGAASTMETKYKYRWVANPQEWGYTEDTIKTFKTKSGKDDEGNQTMTYRIPNPEHSELLNTIIKIASKRAEVDAAESLPGVASVLRQMFGRKGGRSEKGEYDSPVWQRFWGEVRRLGMTDQEAHDKLGVTTMKEWLGKGHSLDEALDIFRGRQPGEPTTNPKAKAESSAESTEDLFPGDAPDATPEQLEVRSKLKRDPDTIKSFGELFQAVWDDFKMNRSAALKELNVSSPTDITEVPAECYRKIAAVRRHED